MPIEYRKSGTREFYKIEGGIVLRVLNKALFSKIDVSDNRLVLDDALSELTKPCSKESFLEAYLLAQERIQTMKI